MQTTRNKSKLHERRKRRNIKFGEFLLPFGPECFTVPFPAVRNKD